jgi:regulator of protease activity HflC (stomatin/prohibitin superfamily)
MVLVLLAVGGAGVWAMGYAEHEHAPILMIGALLLLALVTLSATAFFVVNPNEARVLQLFGRYIGTVRQPGFHWTWPLVTKRAVSQRVRNFDSAQIKVNDLDGNPIEIAAVVVWRVADTAEAVFQVDNYENFLRVQSEAAIRNLASRYPYDSHDEARPSLRHNTTSVTEHLQEEIQQRLEKAGIEIVEARLSHLAYAPEIAQAMLQVQQAGAIVAARTRIVEGAVGMVELALEQLSRKNVVELDETQKATMVSNLLVVLCGERATQPVVNTGTIYR